MLKTKKQGISTIEVIIVLAISMAMFVVVVSTFNTRKRTEVDDGARRVMSEIAKVRNDAQQGEGPATDNGKTLLSATTIINGIEEHNELFGEAIEFDGVRMIIYKLMQKPGNVVTAYESRTIDLTHQLQWWVEPGVGFPSSSGCGGFASCYTQPKGVERILAIPPVGLSGNERLLLVFRNNSGQSFVFSRKNPTISLGSDDFLGTIANNTGNYIAVRQGFLRLAYAVPGEPTPGPGSVLSRQMRNAKFQYYANFELSVPNHQTLEVLK